MKSGKSNLLDLVDFTSGLTLGRGCIDSVLVLYSILRIYIVNLYHCESSSTHLGTVLGKFVSKGI